MERKSHDSQRTAGSEAEAKSLGQQPKTVHHSENHFISEPQHLSQTTSCIACFFVFHVSTAVHTWVASISNPGNLAKRCNKNIKKPEEVAIAGAGRARHAVRECSMERSCATSCSNALTRPNTGKAEMNQNIRVCTNSKTHTHIKICIYIYIHMYLYMYKI